MTNEITPGQMWEDCDPRMKGRRFLILSVSNGKARVFTEQGRESKIRIDRLKAGNRGYRLVSADEPKDEP